MMRVFAAVLLLWGAFPAPSSGGSTSRAVDGDAYAKQVLPLVTKYCAKCHSGEKPKSGINLSSFPDEASALKSRKLWQKVWKALHAREMPPEDKPQPTAAERDKITDWIESILRRPDASGRKDPGRTVLRRLTRAEWSNCVVDLIPSLTPKIQHYFNPEKGFPPDGLFLLHYQEGSSRIPVVDLPPDDSDHGFDNIGEVLTLPPLLMEKYVEAASEVVEAAPKDGRVFIVRPGPQKPKRDAAREILAAFARRAFRRPVPDSEVETFVRLYDQADQRGDSFDSAVKLALAAILIAPDFLFKIERGEGPDVSPGVRAVGSFELAGRLSFFLWNSLPDDRLLSLAADGKLKEPGVLEAEARRMLRSPKAKALSDSFALQWLQLNTFETVMPDPALYPNFYGPCSQGLHLYMRMEPTLYFEMVMIEDRSILEFLDSDWTIANGNLAEFYGLEYFSGRIFSPGKEVAGKREPKYLWKRYTLPDHRRGGVLTMAAVLTATSLPLRTSPVKRGKWILEAILGSPPPPPPPNAGIFKQEEGEVIQRGLRDRLERHRRDPNCAGCHQKMDPPGLALENYDGIGRWRAKEGPLPPQDGDETWDFNVDGHFEEWSFGYYGGRIHVSDGSLNIPITGGGPRIFGPSIAKSAALDKVSIRLKNDSPAKELQFHWLNASQVKWNNQVGIPEGWIGNQRVTVPLEPHSDFKEYTFDLSKSREWKGPIAAVMFETPMPKGEEAKGEISVDWIRIGKNGSPPARPAMDVSATLPNGRKVSSPEELKKALVTDYKDEFVRCFVEHLLTYALGRKLEYYDLPVVHDIGKAVAADGYKFSRVVVEIVKSYPFLHRRTKEAKDDE